MGVQRNPAQVYEDYMVPIMFVPCADHLVARAAPQPGERVLDVGCGTGVVARLVAPLVGTGGSVTGIDPNAAMLAVARERADAEGHAIAWHEGDAASLPFDDGAFDVVVSQQALQFVADKRSAAREMRRVLAPGGRALIATWSPMAAAPVAAALERVVMERFGISPMGVPFGMGGADALTSLLHGAGFPDVAAETVGMTLRMPSYTGFVRQQVLGAAAVVPSLMALSAEEREGVVRAVEEELRPRIEAHLDGDGLRYPVQTDIAIARG